ncbi:MAG: hypothetical protein LBL31_07935, partial [Spirochaetaceae bacterium]|nr:hypothetical protein [Spirochaetaceae bacterium]
MKEMKGKKFFVFGVTAVLLAAGLSLALAGCGDNENDGPGAVTIKAVFGTPPDPSKTAMDLAVWAPDQDVLKTAIGTFKVFYEGSVTGDEVFPAGDDLKLKLPPGPYDFYVEAFDNTTTKNRVAVSNITSVRSGEAVNVYLGPFPSLLSGNLKWQFTVGDDKKLDDDRITLIDLEGRIIPPATKISGAQSTGDGISLNAGSYFVSIPTVEGKGTHQAVVHIYANQTTTMTLIPDDFVDPTTREEASIAVDTDRPILTEQNGVYSADPGVFLSPAWYIDGVKVEKDAIHNGSKFTVAQQGLSADGYSLDWFKASSTLDLHIAQTHTITFLGKAKGKDGVNGVWLSQTEYVKRSMESKFYYVNPSFTAILPENKGLTEETAFATLQQAFDAEFWGDTKTICIVGPSPLVIAMNQTIDGGQDKKTTKITRTDGQNGSVITVVGGEVTFKNVTIDGKNTGNVSVFNRGLKVPGAGTKVTLDTGTAVTGKTEGAANAANSGGGIFIDGGASLVMKGDSVVQDSSAPAIGGGVSVYNGSFTMADSSAVKNNSVAGNLGGGVYVHTSGSFIMSGTATVSGNTSGQDGGGVYTLGTFTMSGSPVISL